MHACLFVWGVPVQLSLSGTSQRIASRDGPQVAGQAHACATPRVSASQARLLRPLRQSVAFSAAVIVTTPQKLAFIDVAKGIRMFAKLMVSPLFPSNFAVFHIPPPLLYHPCICFLAQPRARARPWGACTHVRRPRPLVLPHSASFNASTYYSPCVFNRHPSSLLRRAQQSETLHLTFPPLPHLPPPTHPPTPSPRCPAWLWWRTCPTSMLTASASSPSARARVGGWERGWAPAQEGGQLGKSQLLLPGRSQQLLCLHCPPWCGSKPSAAKWGRMSGTCISLRLGWCASPSSLSSDR